MPPRRETLGQRIIRRLRRLLPPSAFALVQARCRGRSGIEVGGPSAVFRRWNLWPLYPVIGRLDQYNFARRTIWSGPGPTDPSVRGVLRPEPPGRRIIGEASEMAGIPSSSYDFLLASHVLEHIANPLKALHAWAGVVKPGGIIVLVVPHRDGTFDHKRPLSTLDHILADFAADMAEDDTTHLQEILDLHDLSLDPGAGSRDAFVTRAKDNLEHRALHHHTFNTELVLKVVDQAGFRIEYVDVELPLHICVACSPHVPSRGALHDAVRLANQAYWSPLAAWRRRRLFPSDLR